MIAVMSPAMLLAVLGGTFGLAIGSFLNVVIYRVPNGLSVVAPASACPNCHHEIRGFDNVPVLSWLILRGRCRDCATPISARYPAIELLTAIAFVAVAVGAAPIVASAQGGLQLASAVLALVAFLYLAAISVALAAIDVDVHRLPDRIVVPSYAVGGVLLAASALLIGDGGALLRAGIGMVALFVFYFALAFARPGGMGFGDVKLAGVLGIYLGWLGWEALIVGTFAAFLLGGVTGIIAMLRARRVRAVGIPFGPWMIAGAWIGVTAGGPLATGYLRLVGLG